MKTDNEILKELSEATAGLFYMSESDYPFEVINWGDAAEVTPDFLRNLTGDSADSPIEQPDIDALLRGQYQKILEIMKANLSSLKAYRVGRINMPVYMVGRSSNGSWIGLSTRVVQT